MGPDRCWPGPHRTRSGDERNHPRTLAMAASLGVDAMLDDLFTAAAAIDLT